MTREIKFIKHNGPYNISMLSLLELERVKNEIKLMAENLADVMAYTGPIDHLISIPYNIDHIKAVTLKDLGCKIFYEALRDDLIDTIGFFKDCENEEGV